MSVISTGQGPAVLIAEDGVPAAGHELEIRRDEIGYTHPNLHRRMDIELHEEQKAIGELKPREYVLLIQGKDSNRFTETFFRDEENPDYRYIEIP